MRPKDPIERMVYDALTAAQIEFVQGDSTHEGLDFFLPNIGVHIEVKQFHSPRIAEQMARADEVIVIQGRWAAEVFCGLIRNNDPAWATKQKEQSDE
jgi:hypothetical protein